MLPQPHMRNARRLSHAHGLASSAFARHYSRNHFCFLFLRVLRCFTSPRYLPHPMYSDTGNTTSLVLGFPIRTPSDQRSVGSSPRHIAASHVLHRPLMPRHPPCALNILTTQNPPRTTDPEDRRPRRDTYKQTLCKTEIKRCSRPLCSSQRP